jgi:Tol biopolymer transport system component
MCKRSLIRIITLSLQCICAVVLVSCNKITAVSELIPIPPFANPVWHPGGKILGFNHTPISGSPTQGFTYNHDSAGFWLVNSDGTGLHRALTSQLDDPAWSPDGRWIAFSNYHTIWKMPFDGVSFDTTRVYKLTDDKADYLNPAWNTTGDTIYYDSDHSRDTAKPYQIYKMAADGSGPILIGNKGLDSIYSSNPYSTLDGQILHIRGDASSMYVFSMNTNGDNVRKESSYTGSNKVLDNPLKYGYNIFYQDFGIWTTDGSLPVKKIVNESTQGFSISKNGVIAFVNFNNISGSFIDHTHGCIWTANADGSNQQVFIPNYY